MTPSSGARPIGRRALVLCLLSAALVIVIAGCGSSSAAATAAAAAGSGSSVSNYQARLNFAKCMRSHGVNVPDPSANGGPAAGGGAAGPGAGGFRTLRSSPNFQAASTACAKYRARAFGFANITPAQRAQFQQQLVKFAECMRSHAINIPDPTNGGGGGGGFGIFRALSSSERNSPAFQAALKSCSSTLPNFRGGPAGGGVPGA